MNYDDIIRAHYIAAGLKILGIVLAFVGVVALVEAVTR